MARFCKISLISSIALLLFISPGKTAVVNPTRFKVISKQCYYCMGDEKGANNIEVCSTKTRLEIENCPLQDRFDKCIVFQAFSRSKNTTIFKRECTSERFCTKGSLCSDPDFSNCRFECCTGNLCNDFDFKRDPISLTTTQPRVVKITTKDAVQTTMISSKATVSLKTIMAPQTQAKRHRTTTEVEQAGGPTFSPSDTSDNCVDIDKMCASYVLNPSHLVYYCEDYKEYMMVYCQRTCKYCKETPHIATTTKQISTTKKYSDQECVDKDPRCASFVNNPRFCEHNKMYTSAACRKTCKFCKGAEADSTTPKPTSITQEVTSTTPKPASKTTLKPRPRRTVGPSLNAAKPTLKTTEGDRDTPQAGIPVAKSSPTPGQTFTSKTTSPNEDCKDKRTSCQMYKNINFCRIQKWYMEQNCARTCNFCSKDNSNATELASTTPELASTTPELASTTPELTSTTPELASTTPELASTTPELASTTPELASTTPELASTTPELTSTTPELASTTPELASTTPELASTTPELTSTTPELASTTPELASTTPELTSTTPELASTTSELASTTPEHASTTPELTSTTPELASTTPELASTTPELASTTPELTSTTPELASTTLEPKSKAITSQPSQNETTKPTSTPYQESTTKTTSTNEDCKDERPIPCAIYAKISGYCQYTEWFMKIHCPKSCGFCSAENGDGNGHQHGVTKKNTLNPPPIPTTQPKESTTGGATESTHLVSTTPATATTPTTDNGNSLRWISRPWEECVNGLQSRVVRCYNFYHGKDYHVTIHACMKSVGEMPSKTRKC